MGLTKNFFAPSPFAQLHEHSKKVHKCVELLHPLADALLAEDYEKIEELHDLMSRTEYEADQIKTLLRDRINKMYFLSVGRLELSQFLAYQGDVADAAEDFAVVLLLRRTRLPEELKAGFMVFVEQVISVSEQLLNVAERLPVLAEAAFGGREVENVRKTIERIGKEEWEADRLERKFARHLYSIEDKIDPVTIIFLDKYCQTLGAVSNNAEKAAKYLRLVIRTE